MNQKFTEIIVGKTTVSEALSNVGIPLKQTDRDGFTIYWYGTISPVEADFLYIQNDHVVIKSHRFDQQKTIKQFIQELDKPEAILGKTIDGKRDALFTTFYIWPEKGITIQVNGESETFDAVRMIEYSPTSLTNYLETIGKDFKDYQPVTTLETRMSQITNQASPAASAQLPQQFLPTSIRQMFPWILLGLGIVVFIAVLARFIRNRRKKSNSASF